MIREMIAFNLVAFGLIYGLPWLFYILTGSMVEF